MANSARSTENPYFRVFLFHWEPLDAEGFGTYGLHRMILLAPGKLWQDEKLRDRAFTVLASDHGRNLSHLAIGYAPAGLDLARFFLKHWKKEHMDGPCHRDMHSLAPLYRYDHGHIIEYSQERAPGTVHVDGEDDYGTGLTLHVRGYELTEERSQYGKTAWASASSSSPSARALRSCPTIFAAPSGALDCRDAVSAAPFGGTVALASAPLMYKTMPPNRSGRSS